MSSRVQFEIFFGDGSVDNGPNGVQLNNFQRVLRGVDRPAERTFQSVYNWLEKGLRTNRDTHFLTVQTVVNWASEGVRWQLMTISNTVEWKMYIDNALQHGWPTTILVMCFPKDQGAVVNEEEEDCEEEMEANVHE